jgi:cytochrome P450
VAKSREQLTVDFDHHTSARALNSDLAYSELRQACPVAWTEAHGGFWVVTKYDDVDRVVKDHKCFATGDGITIPPPPYGETAMVDFNPPKHTAYRRAMNSTLDRNFVNERLQPRIEHWTNVFIDRVIEAGSCDLVYGIAVPIPAAVTLEWLGWEDREEWGAIGEGWHDLMGRSLDDPRFAKAVETLAWFDRRVAEELEKRRAEPREDTLTHVATVEIDGQRMPDDHAVSLVRVLVGAGVDTTTSLIGSALVHLHYFPDDRSALMEGGPELWETATDEFLRRYTPARTVARTCVQEVALGDATIKPGDRVMAPLCSGNQDAQRFPNPLRVLLDRSGNRHLSFGSGVHRCMGMHLGRAEFRHVVSRVLERMPDYRVAEDELIDYARQSTVAGWMQAPATFTPGARVLPESEDSVALSTSQ